MTQGSGENAPVPPFPIDGLREIGAMTPAFVVTRDAFDDDRNTSRLADFAYVLTLTEAGQPEAKPLRMPAMVFPLENTRKPELQVALLEAIAAFQASDADFALGLAEFDRCLRRLSGGDWRRLEGVATSDTVELDATPDALYSLVQGFWPVETRADRPHRWQRDAGVAALYPMERALHDDRHWASKFRKFRLYLVLDGQCELSRMVHRKRDDGERWSLDVDDLMLRGGWYDFTDLPAVRVSITDPGAGWNYLTISLHPNDHYRRPPQCDVHLSDVTDSIIPLFWWCARISSGERDAWVEIEEGSQARRLSVRSIGDEPNVVFRVHDSNHPMVYLLAVVDRYALVAAFARAFIRFFPSQFNPARWETFDDYDLGERRRSSVLRDEWLAPWYELAVRREREFSQSGGPELRRSAESPFLAPAGCRREVLYLRGPRQYWWDQALGSVFQVLDHEIVDMSDASQSYCQGIWQSPGVLVMFDIREVHPPLHPDYPVEIELFWKSVGVPGGVERLSALAWALRSDFLIKSDWTDSQNAYDEYRTNGSHVQILYE